MTLLTSLNKCCKFSVKVVYFDDGHIADYSKINYGQMKDDDHLDTLISNLLGFFLKILTNLE